MPRPRNWTWLAARLADPRLLTRGVIVNGEIAVPVGGRRRGGFVFVDSRADGLRVLASLRGRAGFPRPRLVMPRRYAATVRWGARAPLPPRGSSALAWARHDVAAGRYYGYTDAAIRRFVRREYGAVLTALAIGSTHRSVAPTDR